MDTTFRCLGSRYGLVVVLGLLVACKDASTFRDHRGMLVRLLAPERGLAPAATGALAIGIDMATELQISLEQAGLTPPQAAVVADGSKQELEVVAGEVAISALALVDKPPIVVAAGPVVKGAIKTLDDPRVGLDDVARRAAIAKVVMSSTFSSLGGRVAELPTAQLFQLQKDMVGAAVLALNDGGLGGDQSADAMQAVTSGAVEALAKSVTSDQAMDAAAELVSGAIENLAASGLPSDKLGDLVSAATSGVVGGLSQAGVENAAVAAGAVAKASVASLKSLSLGDDDKILAVTELVAAAAVSSLVKNGSSEADLLQAAEEVATAAVSALTTAGVSDRKLGQGAGTIASGAIQGLDTAKISSETMISSGAIATVVSSAVGALAKTDAAANLDKAAMVADVAATAVGAIAKTSVATANLSVKSQMLSAVIDGGTKGIMEVGLTGISAMASLTSISQQSVAMLASTAGNDASALSLVVVTASAEKAVSANLGSAADVMTAVSTGFANGAKINNISVDGDALLIAVQDSATKLGVTGGAAINAVLSGVAVVGTSSVLDAMSASINSGTALSSLSDAELASVSSALTKAQETATAIAAGLPACEREFPDSFNNDQFFQKVFASPQPVLCAAAATGCPSHRDDKKVAISWSKIPGTDNCQLMLKPTGAGVILPNCSVFSGLTMMSELKTYFNSDIGAIACSKDAVASCPAVPSDAKGALYIVASNQAINDMCVLVNQDQGAQVNVISCRDAGIGNQGITLTALKQMTPDPYQPQARLCAVLSSAENCPGIDSALSNYVFSSGQSMSTTGKQCRYVSQLNDCSSMFPSATPLTASVLESVMKHGGGFEGTSCAVSISEACPAVADPAFYSRQEMPLSGLSLKQCRYNLIYPNCDITSTEFAPVLDTTLTTAMRKSPGDSSRWACMPSSMPVNFSDLYLPALSLNLFNAGFERSWVHTPGGSLFVVQSNARSCNDMAGGASVDSKGLEHMPLALNIMARVCDLPMEQNCPNLDVAVTGYDVEAIEFSVLSLRRCLYRPASALNNCPTTLDATSLLNLSVLSSRYDAGGRSYGCGAASCPSLDPTSFAGLSVPGPLSIDGLCVYRTPVNFCADTTDNGVINNLYRLGGGSMSVKSCDLMPSEIGCPQLDIAGFTISTSQALADSPYKRCYITPSFVATCPGTLSGLSDLTPITGQGSMSTPGLACLRNVAANCPSLSGYSYNAVRASASSFMCEYFPSL